ncbi:hypothetical protein M409DRAFT_56255 [Zasmidium cellare ATCC 36951]|uniref:Mid2 domain-containing protein n=1 Tax=Zasmidium cellare ATCC 36951 TaxID=1080233 RepID=A0A6A6CFF9_ZASCE|nr:uncharacterized protein M409DRAFT_56255 [Zasmidium cellare ATCC 36951]KAF2164898.1 hypothetical protein M409DRAFT_56255 [Zasmidium cellare ATCC 36951]
MPFSLSLSQALAAATLLISLGTAQQCYYPDGSPSTDTPCSTNGDSSCCSSSSFCMDNGLCFGGGIVSRGSCTDKTWGSSACTGYCKTDSPSGSIALTPCSDDGGSSSFVCGLNASACDSSTGVFTMSGGGSFVLRPAQVRALIEPVLNSSTAASSASQTTVTSCPSSEPSKPQGMYSAAQMAGLGCGLGLPLLFAICAAVFLFLREKGWRRDSIIEPDSYNFRPPPPITIQHSPFRSAPVSRDGSDVGSMQTMTTNGQEHLHSFLDRYHPMNEKTGKVPVHRVELDGSPVSMDRRREMGERATIQEGNRF